MIKSNNQGVLVSSTQQSGHVDGYKNIGDYTQSLAQLSFINDKNIVYVDKERMSDFRSESGPVKVIMNAWLMVFPQYWPPSKDIKPLLISVHISPTKAEEMLTQDGIAFLKEHGPVGCRDLGTVAILKKHDIPCYFSGCLTLTLGEQYHAEKKNGAVYFVDPYIESVRAKDGRISIPLIVSNVIFGLVNLSKIVRLYRKFHHFYCVAGKILAVKKFIAVSAFYRAYRTKFSDELLFSAEYVTQSEKVGQGTSYKTEQAKLDLAASFVQKYSEASLVITSRIHCGLPCLAIGTPVLFVHSDGAGHVRDPGRFDGIVELLNVLNYQNFVLNSTDEGIPNKIDLKNLDQIKNRETFKSLAQNMVTQCRQFFAQT